MTYETSSFTIWMLLFSSLPLALIGGMFAMCFGEDTKLGKVAKFIGFGLALTAIMAGLVMLVFALPSEPDIYRVTLNDGTVYEEVYRFHTPSRWDSSYHGYVNGEHLVFSNILKYEVINNI